MIINNNNAHTFNMFYNVLGNNPLFKGSTIIRFVLICSIDTLCFWTSSFTTKYLNFICLAPLEYLSFLQKNIVAELSQYIFSGLAILSTIPSPEIKFRSQLAWIVASKHTTNSALRCNNNWCIQNYFHLFSFHIISRTLCETNFVSFLN